MPFPPGIRIARNSENVGFAENVNRAVHAANGEYVLILNQDTRALSLETDAPVVRQLLKPGWLEAMLSVFTRFPDVGIVGPRLVFPNGVVQSVGGLFDGGKGPYHRMLGWSNPVDERISETCEVSWITGAALMIRKADFMTVGGLDGAYYPGGYFEDVDLCMRVRHQLGKKVYYCAEATLVHEVGSTGGNPNFRQNSIAFHRRWDDKIEPDSKFVYVNY